MRDDRHRNFTLCYVFVLSTVSALPGPVGHFLGRIFENTPAKYTHSNRVWNTTRSIKHVSKNVTSCASILSREVYNLFEIFSTCVRWRAQKLFVLSRFDKKRRATNNENVDSPLIAKSTNNDRKKYVADDPDKHEDDTNKYQIRTMTQQTKQQITPRATPKEKIPP